MVTKRFPLSNQEEALYLFGQHDRNLKALEHNYGVQIFVKPSVGGEESISLAIRGRSGMVDTVYAKLNDMREKLKSNMVDIKKNLDEDMFSEELAPDIGADPDAIYVTYAGRLIKPKSSNQKKYVEAIRENDLVICIGPAGTGKTYLSVACALAAFHSGKVSRIVLTRPVVEAGEKLGFLPGDFYEKVNPYLKPLYDAFYSMIGPDKFRMLRDEETIEIVPLAYMRGRTLDDAFVILDEGQNTTSEQMKMFLTRLGSNSQAVVGGDITQIDLENKKFSGLVQARDILRGIKGISLIELNERDTVRHGLVQKIIKAYEDRNGGRR